MQGNSTTSVWWNSATGLWWTFATGSEQVDLLVEVCGTGAAEDSLSGVLPNVLDGVAP